MVFLCITKVSVFIRTVYESKMFFFRQIQVDYVGRNILSKLLNEWRLMDELGVLRAIYLLGSGIFRIPGFWCFGYLFVDILNFLNLTLHFPHPGDLLQHFLTVIFDKLDKGESWDDDFELNMLLQVNAHVKAILIWFGRLV